MVEIKAIKLKDLEENRGQLIGLPANPRFIRDDKYRQTLESIKANPEMMALRELLVYPLPGEGKQKYIIIGGNQRYRALKELGEKEAVCKVIPKETVIERLKAYTIKDNAAYGKWDMNMLANEWEREDLGEWGLDVMQEWSDDTKEQDFSGSNTEINTDDFDEEMSLSVVFTSFQLAWVKEKLAEIDDKPNVALLMAAGWGEFEQ